MAIQQAGGPHKLRCCEEVLLLGMGCKRSETCWTPVIKARATSPAHHAPSSLTQTTSPSPKWCWVLLLLQGSEGQRADAVIEWLALILCRLLAFDLGSQRVEY